MAVLFQRRVALLDELAELDDAIRAIDNDEPAAQVKKKDRQSPQTARQPTVAPIGPPDLGQLRQMHFAFSEDGNGELSGSPEGNRQEAGKTANPADQITDPSDTQPK